MQVMTIQNELRAVLERIEFKTRAANVTVEGSDPEIAGDPEHYGGLNQADIELRWDKMNEAARLRFLFKTPMRYANFKNVVDAMISKKWADLNKNQRQFVGDLMTKTPKR